MSIKVLVIGAGRIGAEALAHVVSSGFDDIQIIDMESKDVENLREQFVGTSYSVGKPRAEMICESILSSIPNVQLEVTNYGHSFLQQFHLVLNALDNRLDRDKMNVMCIIANVSYIDCYECAAQDLVSNETIHKTPSDPTHCLAWSIHLFRQLFDRSEVIDKIRLVQTEGSKVLNSLLKWLGQTTISYNESIRQLLESPNNSAQLIFKNLFGDNIKHDASDSLETNSTGIVREYKTWTQYECQRIFVTSLTELQKGMAKQDEINVIRVESAALDFVTAAANLRATIHGISMKSRLEIKFILTLVLDDIFGLKLLDMPNEVLDYIFDCFDDETLLAASRTCKRLVPIVATTFERKYANQTYKLTDLEDIEYQKMHRAILINFGAKFTDIEVSDADFTDEHDWLIQLLKENVTTLKRLKLSTEWYEADINLGEIFLLFPNSTHLKLDGYVIEEDNWTHIHMPFLTNISLTNLPYVEPEFFNRFFDNNRQIECLIWEECTNEITESINNRLNRLKMLAIPDYQFEIISPVNLESLEILTFTESTDEILDAFVDGCKKIKQLSITFDEGIQLNKKYIEKLEKFELIESLEIADDEITIEEIKLVERRIPQLKSFSVISELESLDDDENHQLMIDEILSMISKTKILTKLTLTIDIKCTERFDAEFHARFLEAIGVNRPSFELYLELEGQRNHTINLKVMKHGITCSTCDSAPVIVYRVGSSSPMKVNEMKNDFFT